jgi:D-2-hydroxyacid dehydrogenase (NADP+)
MTELTTSPPGILVSPKVAQASGPRILELARAAGLAQAQLFVLDSDRMPDAHVREQIGIALMSFDVIGGSSKTVTEPQLAVFFDTVRASEHLRWMQAPSAGLDRPIYRELHARGVFLTTAAGANAKAVAHSAVAGLLALARRLPQVLQALRGELLPAALEGQHAVVVGMGQIGLDIARVLRALGLRVTGVRRQAQPHPDVDRVIAYEDIDQVLPDAQWLVLACPLSPITAGLVSRHRLALLPAEANLVNVARGEVVDEGALADALAAGRLAGAFLDVFLVEPLAPEAPFWAMPNAIVSAHSAGHSTAHEANVVDLFLRNLPRFLAQEPLVNEWKPG